MKAIVVEVKNRFVAAMTEDGRVIRMKNQNYTIGEVIQMKKTFLTRKTVVAAASIAAVMSVGSLAAWGYNTPYRTVSLDVNPSIEYELNVFDRVLDTTAVNDDGEAILDNLDLGNLPIEEAIQQTVQEITNEGYLTDDELGGIVIAVTGEDDKAVELADTLGEEAQTAAEDAGVEAEVEAIAVGAQRVEEAKALGVTPGKLNLVQKLQASNPDAEISVEEWLDQPVKKIMKAIKDNRKGEPEDTDTADETTASSSDSQASETSVTTSAADTASAAKQAAVSSATEKKTDKTANQNSKKPAETTSVTAQTEPAQTTVAPETTKKNEAPAKTEKETQTEKVKETQTEKVKETQTEQVKETKAENTKNENASDNGNGGGKKSN